MEYKVITIFALCLCGALHCVSARCLGSKDLTGHQCGVEASSNLVHRNPWLVFLEYYRGKSRYYIRCAGSLISSRHIITAAHCVVGTKFSKVIARLGEYDTSSKVDCVDGVCADPLVRIAVSDIVVHPDYRGSEHDIAILTLDEDAPYTDFIRPICFPTQITKDDVTFVATGWGELVSRHMYSETKKIIPLPRRPVSECERVYKHISLPKNIICAGGEEGIDTCKGDSGGPLTLIRDTVELWGVTSRGNIYCGMKGTPGMYTSVTDHMDWIKKVIKFT